MQFQQGGSCPNLGAYTPPRSQFPSGDIRTDGYCTQHHQTPQYLHRCPPGWLVHNMPAASVLKAAMCTFDTLGCNVHRAELAVCVGEVMQYYSIPCCAQYASPQLQIPFCGQQTNIIHTCRTGSISCRDIRARNTVFRIRGERELLLVIWERERE